MTETHTVTQKMANTLATKVSDLCEKCVERYGNINMVLSMLILKNQQDTGIREVLSERISAESEETKYRRDSEQLLLFGGILRDTFGGMKSNDIDLMTFLSEEFFSFRYEDGEFKDKYILDLSLKLEKYGIRLEDVERKIDIIKGKYFLRSEETEVVPESADGPVDDEELQRYIENPTCAPDHLKYTAYACIGEKRYRVELDISFLPSIDAVTKDQATIEDSLYLDGSIGNEFSDAMLLTDTPGSILDKIKMFWKQNVNSFLDVDVQTVLQNLSSREIEVFDVKDPKRKIKLMKLIANGWTIKTEDLQRSMYTIEQLVSSLRSIQDSEDLPFFTDTQRENVQKLLC